jgi:hypothetical protein
MKDRRTKGGAAKSKSKGRKLRSDVADHRFFDTKAGIFTATILSLLLWWVPYLGPMAAGFMGGRKAGSLYRGAFAGALACVIVIAFTTALSVGVAAILTDHAEAVESFSPFIFEKIGELSDYLTKFVTVSGSSIFFDQSTYFLMVALSIIGGAFADQSRKEVKAIVGAARDTTKPAVPRSVRAHRENRNVEFQTYEDYARMSVNVTSVPEPRSPEKKPAQRPAAEPQFEPVVHVPQTSVPANTTMTSSSSTTVTADNVPEPARVQVPTSSAKDEFEFL